MALTRTTDTQPGAIGDREGRLVLEVASRLDQSPHFIGTEHDGQYAGHAHRLHPDHQFGPVERDCEEELQAGDRVVQRRGRCAVVDTAMPQTDGKALSAGL